MKAINLKLDDRVYIVDPSSLTLFSIVVFSIELYAGIVEINKRQHINGYKFKYDREISKDNCVFTTEEKAKKYLADLKKQRVVQLKKQKEDIDKQIKKYE